jgi:hypothetical protein
MPASSTILIEQWERHHDLLPRRRYPNNNSNITTNGASASASTFHVESRMEQTHLMVVSVMRSPRHRPHIPP